MKTLVAIVLGTFLFTSTALAKTEKKILRAESARPNSWVVSLTKDHPNVKKSVKQLVKALGEKHKGKIQSVWDDAIPGFSVEMSEDEVTKLLDLDEVSSVEEDAFLQLSGEQSTLSYPPPPYSGPTEVANPLYYLDRIDRWGTELDGKYGYCGSGYGTIVYVVDTGVYRDHREFMTSPTNELSRVEPGVAFGAQEGESGSHDYGWNPCFALDGIEAYVGNCSHGTRVASLIAGLNVGVAKATRIVPVKVFPTSPFNPPGTLTNLIDGLKWIVTDYANRPTTPAVVNMSLFYVLRDYVPPQPAGYPNATFLHAILETAQIPLIVEQVRALTNAGITVVVSANNQKQDAMMTMPARLGHGNSDDPNYQAIRDLPQQNRVITVGGTTVWGNPATGYWEAKWSASQSPWQPWCDPISTYPYCSYLLEPNLQVGSNFGPAVDIWAPAFQILAATTERFGGANYARPYRYAVGDGTSFSSALVAGVAARFATGRTVSPLLPSDVWSRIRNSAEPNSNLGLDLSVYAPEICRPRPARRSPDNAATYPDYYDY